VETENDTPKDLPPSRGIELRREALIAKAFPGRIARPRLGRYEVVGLVGEGGMGTVFAAYDASLDRRVAIKSLRRGHSDPSRRARLQREAKVLAQLDHPNIITIHEVWEEDGEIYLAMEYVEGEDLSFWQTAKRPWREIVDAYRQAGEGLVGVHEAGLVYRDFKPANVIRRHEDGVVKLLDFGLARIEEDDSSPGERALHSVGFRRPTEDASSTDPPRQPAEDALTHAGSLVGTPAYMAPEQFLGAPADARSDQFSFAVSLWEALYKQRPFLRELGRVKGEFDERWFTAPRDHHVPSWVRRVVERGMARDPSDRFPSMRALLEDLGRDPAIRRRRLALGLSLAALTVSGGWAVAELRGAPSSTCVPPEVPWSADRREAVRTAIERVDDSASETWMLLEPRLARYGEELTEVRGEACRAHERGLLPAEHHALEGLCLDRAEAGFDELIHVLARGDATAVENANRAITELPAPTDCTRLEVLTAEERPPDEIADRVGALRNELARSAAEEAAGLYAEAATRAGGVLAEADDLGYAPLRAEALLRRGSARMQENHEGTLADFDQALWLSLELGEGHIAAEAAAKRVFVKAALADVSDVSDARDMARALVRRLSTADWRIRWLLSNNIGTSHHLRGETVEALEAYDEALSWIPTDEGRFERASTLFNRSTGLLWLGRHGDAVSSVQRAVDEYIDLFGPEHSKVHNARVMLARTHRFLGHYAQARAILEEEIGRFTDERSIPFDTIFERVQVAQLQGDWPAALSWIRRVEPRLAEQDRPDSWRKEFGLKEAELAAARHDELTVRDTLAEYGSSLSPYRQAELMLLLGRAEDAEALLVPIVRDEPTRYGEYTVYLLGRALLAQERWIEARERLSGLIESDDFVERLALLERARIVLALAEAELGMGQRARAEERLAQALALLDGFDRDSEPVREAQALRARLDAATAPP